MIVTREMGQRVINNKRVGGCLHFNYLTVAESCQREYCGKGIYKKCVMLDGHPCNFYEEGNDEI